MAHFLHYWAPDRAALAFDGSGEGVSGLENGWFKRLATGDVLWLLTRTGERLQLVLRAEIAGQPVKKSTHPIYAIRNSTSFSNYRVKFTERVPPYAITMSLRTLRQLRFDGASESIAGLNLDAILYGPLGSLRRLRDESIVPLEQLWGTRAGNEWISIAIRRAGRPVFATAEHRLKVERIAVDHVTRAMKAKGWNVVSCERDGVGYDLRCTRGRLEWHVEVKGTSNDDPLFFMTRGERDVASKDSSFRLAVVTSALERPGLRFHTGKRLLDGFEFVPLAFSVRPKSVRGTRR